MRKLRELRQARRMTQTQLAYLAGLHPQLISAFERGYAKPYHSQLERLAAALGVAVEDLEGDDDERDHA
ncbi:MAG TPA: helix-turn-helix transcriptional regulator [Firmicutes bacterium]|nr:helix-turn-helix transcriptional regulator [Bacillota bacterium]